MALEWVVLGYAAGAEAIMLLLLTVPGLDPLRKGLIAVTRNLLKHFLSIPGLDISKFVRCKYIRLFSHKCGADDLKPHLHKIMSKLLGFLQRGKTMMKEAALETLASLPISAQEDSAYIYDSIMPYLGNCY